MDYTLDFYSRRDVSVTFPNFIYDDSRFCSKLYVFLKTIGLALYTTTLTRCTTTYYYIIMILVMFLSTVNSARYEYQHYKRYGTTFSSVDEYDVWKGQLLPNTRLLFSMVELGIKTGFFIKTFPPQFDFTSTCDIGESIFKIHILTLFSLYTIAGIFSICIYCSFFCNNRYPSNRNIIQQAEPGQIPIQLQVPIQLPLPIQLQVPLDVIIILDPNEECCICMDIGNNQSWIVLPCDHKFHGSCISRWLDIHNTCPVCRLNMSVI